MANAKDIAGLAALAGLAYMNRDKLGFGSDATGPGSTAQERGDSSLRINAQKNAVSGNLGKSAAPTDAATALKTPAESISSADKSMKEMYPSGVFGGATQSENVGSGKQKNYDSVGKQKKQADLYKAVSPSTSSSDAKDSRMLEADKSRGMRPSEMDLKKSELNSANGAASESALRSDQLAGISRAEKREDKTKQFAKEVPYQESSRKTDAMAVASRAARAADAKKRAAKKNTFKMASGGMTSSASRRADGIASKGKTRGKIC